MGCKAKYVPIGANAFLKSIYPHHAARVSPEATKESERVGCQSRVVTSGPDKWQRDPRFRGDIQNPAYRAAGQLFTGVVL
jgi:hypothetical protein